MMRFETTIAAAVFAVGALVVSASAEARSFRVSQVPNGSVLQCDTCHIFPGGPRNDFGLQVEASLPSPKASQNVNWQLVYELDADQDGFTNGQELGDPDGNWGIGDPNPPLGSDPSDEFDTPAGAVPRCTPGAESVCDGQDNNCNGQVDEGVTCSPPALVSATLDEVSIVADGTDFQTLRVTLSNASAVDDLRVTINHPWHVENGRPTSGYFQITPTGCSEIGGLGNAEAVLDTVNCSTTPNQDGSRTYVMRFAYLGAFGSATNNQVSAIWYQGGVAVGTWKRLTATGQGFAVTADPGFVPPAALQSFSFGASTVVAGSDDVQTLRLTLSNATSIDDVRLIVNHSWHTENGRPTGGYFQITPTTCIEVGGGLGNADVAINGGNCQINNLGNGSFEYVIPYRILSSFGGAANFQVSALWLANGVAPAGTWKRVTTSGQGFAVTADPGFVPPAALQSFSFDQASVAADGIEVQTLRLTLSNAASIDDVRLMINHAWHVENGQAAMGYFKITPTTCAELGSFGNANVTLLDNCEINDAGNGAVEFVLNFVVLDTAPLATNYQVSALWLAGGVAPAGTWKRVTTSGQGFTVADGISSYRSFSFDEASVVADGIEVQTFRVTLNSADNVSDLRLIVNHANHSQNGRNCSAFFRYTGAGCQEFTTGCGNANVTLLTQLCEANANPDGSIEFVMPFTISSSFGAANNNQVGVFWYEGATLIQGLTRATVSGQGFNVTAP